MALTKRDLVTWMELVQLIAQMTLAAVAALKDDDPVDFDAVKIRLTPEEALQRARVDKSEKQIPPPRPRGRNDEHTACFLLSS